MQYCTWGRMNEQRYYFDITDLLSFARSNSTLSGIQRVVLRLVGHLVDKQGSDVIRLTAYHPRAGGLIELNSHFLHAAYVFNQTKFFSDCGLPSNVSLKHYLNEKYTNRPSRSFHRRRLKILNYLTSGQTFEELKIGNNGLPEGIRSPSFTENDTIILLGSSWPFPELIEAIEAVKQSSGARVALMVHDLIPVVAPEYVSADGTQRFQRWIRSVSGIADLFMTISNHTRADLESFLQRERLLRWQLHVVRLAHEFITSGESIAPINRLTARKVDLLDLTRRPYVLCVGTWESRKNLLVLAAVWQALSDELGPDTPTLVLAGKPGFGTDALNQFLANRNHVNGYVRICDRPNDGELEYLYRNCLFTVFPSLYEGWGLPIGESLWFGKFVVSSNRSSAPEAGGDMADYVDPTVFKSVLEGIKRPIVDREYLAARTAEIQRDKLRTWQMVADDLWRAISPGQPLAGDASRFGNEILQEDPTLESAGIEELR